MNGLIGIRVMYNKMDVTKSYIETIQNYFNDIINPIYYHIINDMHLNSGNIILSNYETNKKLFNNINIDKKPTWLCITSYDNNTYNILYFIESNIKQFYLSYNNSNIFNYEFIKIIIIGLLHELRHVYQFEHNLFNVINQVSLMETDAELFASKYFECDKGYFNLHIHDILNKYSGVITNKNKL